VSRRKLTSRRRAGYGVSVTGPEAARIPRAPVVTDEGGKMKRKLIAAILGFAAIGGQAQDFPVRAINLIVPNPPGGMNQIHAQPLGAVIEKLYKQPAPVLNKPGATAAAGTGYVANQPPDGYNVLVTTPNVYLALEKDKLFGVQSPYSLDKLAPIALLSADPLTFCVQAESPIKSVSELVAAAKAKQGTMSFSSSGPYGITHVPAAMFMDAAGIKMRHVPTTGGGPAVIQLLGGHVDMHDGGLAAVYPHIKSGKLRALALSDVKRSPALAEVPTFKELGYDVEAYLWVGLFTAAGVPEPVFNKLRDVIRKAVADPLFQDSMTKVQVVIDYRDAPEFKKFFEADYKRLAGVVKSIGRIEEAK
jgi:tripartite-type tricarboxylate transporter receptor subunit TctC